MQHSKYESFFYDNASESAVLITRKQISCISDLDHAQLKQLCDDALKKIEQLIESASKTGIGGKQYDLIKADLHTAIMVAGENQAKLASAQVCLFYSSCLSRKA